jgi:predicted nucleic acid-binding protein
LSLFVDTSVWSLTFRRDAPERGPEVRALIRAIEAGDEVYTTGLVLQELLQGFAGPRNRQQIIERFGTLPIVVPDRRDHVEAAELRNQCRRHGIQVGTIDVLLGQLCIRHNLIMLTADQDFHRIARHSELQLWQR